MYFASTPQREGTSDISIVEGELCRVRLGSHGVGHDDGGGVDRGEVLDISAAGEGLVELVSTLQAVRQVTHRHKICARHCNL